MIRKIVQFTGALFFTVSMSSQQLAKGTVYGDIDANGKKGRGEKGISGVAVTNGSTVVLTDEKGRYRLPVGADNIISVIKPSGYRVPVDENNLPRFFYRYKPDGSPNSKFPGVPPTGKLPGNIDFGLLPGNGGDKFTALIFGDPQPYSMEEIGYFDKGIVDDVKITEDTYFGLSLGDLVGNDLDLFGPYVRAVKKIGIPWYNVMGNHDMNFDAKSDTLSDETFETYFGPASYAFNQGKIHFIVLDDVLYPDPRDGKGYWGGLRPDQLEFIKNDLKHVPKDHLIVLAFHIPLAEFDRDLFRDSDRKKLFDLLKDFPNTLSLSAHTHIQRQDFFGKEDGWQRETPHHEYNVGTTSGDWYSGKLDAQGIPISVMRDGTPRGYALIHFTGNQYEIEYRVAGKPKDFQIGVFAPKVVAKGRRTKAGIYANFFMGSKGDTVLYRVDDGEWKEMDYLEDYDPSYVDLVNEWDTSEELMPGRRSSDPIDSKHLWRAGIPSDLPVGEHTITVRAIDRYGKKHEATRTYRLEAPK